MKNLKPELKFTVRSIVIIFMFLLSNACSKIPTTSVEIFYEKIPGSKNHGPNGTWWGYNQSKIIRYGNSVYMYVVENENIDNNPNPNATNPSKIAIYRKEGNGSWQKGASFNTSRPGNILVDSDGVVHLIVFEPTYIKPDENGSFGKLKHYWFPNSPSGNITSYQQETIVDNDGATQGETVNIRVGAAIGSNDMIVVSFGINDSHKAYYKEKNGTVWTMETAGNNLGDNYYYPYVLVTASGIGIMAIQDGYVGDGLPNTYQKIYYFEKNNGTWNQQSIIDLQSHPLASTRPQLVETSDIYQDANNKLNVIYSTRLDPADQYLNTFTLATKNGTSWQNQSIQISDKNTGWIRIIEINGDFYYLCSAWDKLYLKKGTSGNYVKLNVPKVDGMYIYVTSPRGGTSSSESYIDILILCGYNDSYPNADNYYLRIEKSELAKIFL